MLGNFSRWSWDNSGLMEELGSDEGTALLNLVPHRFAEYASGCIDALEWVDSSQADPLVRQDLADQRIAGA